MYIIYIALVLIYKATSIVLPYSIGKYIDNINQERMGDNHNVKMVSCFGESFAVQFELK